MLRQAQTTLIAADPAAPPPLACTLLPGGSREGLTWEELGGTHLLQSPVYDAPPPQKGGEKCSLVVINDIHNLQEEEEQIQPPSLGVSSIVWLSLATRTLPSTWLGDQGGLGTGRVGD